MVATNLVKEKFEEEKIKRHLAEEENKKLKKVLRFKQTDAFSKKSLSKQSNKVNLHTFIMYL